MTTEHTIKLGDTLPAITATLTGGTGAAQDLAGATVRIAFRAVGGLGAPALVGDVTIVSATAGTVSYTFPVGATAALGVGIFQFEFEVALSGGGVATFPSDGYHTLRIISDIVPVP